jgi:hypothetical protein
VGIVGTDTKLFCGISATDNDKHRIPEADMMAKIKTVIGFPIIPLNVRVKKKRSSSDLKPILIHDRTDLGLANQDRFVYPFIVVGHPVAENFPSLLEAGGGPARLNETVSSGEEAERRLAQLSFDDSLDRT